MTLRPFFSYYGGKWRLAPKYPAPRYPIIVEPFAGSAGYATRHHERHVFLADRDPEIAACWQWLIAADPADVLALPLDVPDLRVSGLPDPVQYLIRRHYNQASTGGSGHTPSTWQKQHGANSAAFWSARKRQIIADQVQMIRHWKAACLDYRELNDVEATWFIDPPYSVDAGRKYVYNAMDFDELAEWCRTRRGQVIVCGQMGETYLPFRALAEARGRMRHTTEAIWTNDV